jgi:hypothetical protein
MKINNDAIERKLWQTSPVVDVFQVCTKVQDVLNLAADSLWESTNGISLLKQLWKVGRGVGDTTTNSVTWTYRYITTPDSFKWNVGGAFGANIDVVDTVMDSLHQNRSNTADDVWLTWDIPAQSAVRMMGDTTDNHGWVWHNYYNNQVGGLNDAEIIYFSADEGVVAKRPQIRVHLSSYGSEGTTTTTKRLLLRKP